MAQAETFSLPNSMSNEIAALVKAGIYSSKSDVAKDAIRLLLNSKPVLKLSAAIELYNEGKVSIGRAAEIAEMSTVDFKEELAARGIKRIVKSNKERRKKGLDILRKAR